MDINHHESQEVLVSKEACLQFGGGCLSGVAIVPFQLWLPPPPRLSLAGDGPVCSRLALLIPFLCKRAWQCFRLQLFTRLFSLSLFLSLSLAIPQSGLLSHVSSLRLPSGNSGPVLTLSNAAHASLSSPRLLVADGSVWAASLLGVSLRHAICGF